MLVQMVDYRVLEWLMSVKKYIRIVETTLTALVFL